MGSDSSDGLSIAPLLHFSTTTEDADDGLHYRQSGSGYGSTKVCWITIEKAENLKKKNWFLLACKKEETRDDKGGALCPYPPSGGQGQNYPRQRSRIRPAPAPWRNKRKRQRHETGPDNWWTWLRIKIVRRKGKKRITKIRRKNRQATKGKERRRVLGSGLNLTKWAAATGLAAKFTVLLPHPPQASSVESGSQF